MPCTHLRWILAMILTAVLAGCQSDQPFAPGSLAGPNGVSSIVSAASANSRGITIVLDMQPNRPTDVTFETEGRKLRGFVLDDDVNSALPSSQTFRLRPGTYTVKSEALAGLTILDITCESNPNGGGGTDNNTLDLANRSVTIQLDRDESVVCTFVGYLPIWENGDLITYSQATWGDATTNAARLLLTNFGNVYPLGLEVGISGSAGYSIIFTLSGEILLYLPAVGPSGALNADLVDPTSSSSGSFGGEVTALALNIDFSDAGVTLGSLAIPFGDLTLCNMENPPAVGLSLFNGLTVRQVLGGANTLLGGGTAAFYSIPEWELVSNDLNGSFSGGVAGVFAQEHLVSGACP